MNSKHSRRNFLNLTSKGVLGIGIAGELVSCIAKSQNPPVPLSSAGAISGNKISFPAINASTEKKEGDPANPLPPEKRIGYAIVGLGHLALGQLLPAFGQCKKSKLTALVSGSPDKAMAVAKQYGVKERNIYNYENYDNLKDNPEVDVIYIVLPNGMHAEYTIRGANAGKHILCEKPMANTVKECEDMIAACDKAGKKLMVAYRIQYEPNNAHIKQMVRDHKFGKAGLITSSNGQNTSDPNQWRLKKKLSGGGSIPDVGIYCINTIRYLTGEEPIEIFATISSDPQDIRFKEVEDRVSFEMKFPSGLIASCNSFYSLHESRNYRVYAEKGYMGMDPAFSYQGLKMYKSFVEEDMEIHENPQINEQNQFTLEMDHMSECIIENKMPYTPGQEGMQDMKIIEAIYKSAKEGKPVKLPKYPILDFFRGENVMAMKGTE